MTRQGEQLPKCLPLILAAILGATLIARSASAQNDGRGGRQGGGRQGAGKPREVALPADMQALAKLSAVAGRPSMSSLAVNVLSAVSGQALVEYGTVTGQYRQKTAPVACTAGVPVEITLSGLTPDSDVFYRVQVDDTTTGEQHFHTARAPGSGFTFEIQGDSHPERPQMFDAGLYAQTLRAAAADYPDFYLAIGDDFSVDTLQSATAEVDRIYRTQRLFLSLVDAPLFLVNGNHEQAARCNLDDTANNMAVWAGTCRNKYFALPAPDDFYSGDAQPVEHIGLLRDYYAWTWGDALFVAIDPYWHSPGPVDNVYGERAKQRNRDLWQVTLGEEQYRWLQRTLQQSRARYKFVFTHHVLGTGRGGIEEAGLYEWGGNDPRGASEFTQKRPGWELPIQQLLARNGVTIFFQGHDHVFVKQELDGVVYQSLPLPADPYYALYNRDAYRSGEALPGSGRVRVTVAPDKVSVAYVRSYLPKDETSEHKNGEIGYSYEIPTAR